MTGAAAMGWRTPVVMLVCGTLIVLISLGVRMTFGLWLGPATAELWPGEYRILSLTMALQSLFWGLATPVAGNIADRYGAGRVIAAAGVLYSAGLLLMTAATTPLLAHLSIGVLTGFAMSGAMFPIILSALTRVVPERRRDLYLGIASAGGSSGQVLLVPIGQSLIDAGGWAFMLHVMAALTALIVPLSFAMAGRRRAGAAAGAAPGAAPGDGPGDGHGTLAALRMAFGHRGYMLLTGGYFVCGLQTMFIATHFPFMLTTLGTAPGIAAYSLSLIGLFNIVGTFAWGVAGGRFRQKYLLCWLYSLRSVAMVAFIALPVTDAGVVLFSAAMGLLWLGTVPLTGSIVARVFGLRHMGMLFGLAFVAHQLGSFVGIYAAGHFYDLFGNYDVVWWSAVVMGFVASLMNYPINDAPVGGRTAAQAA